MELSSVKRFKRRQDPNKGFTDVVVYYCRLCDIECETENEFHNHLATEHHIFRWTLDKIERKRKNLIKERHGICIEVVSSNDVDYHRFKGLVNVNVQPFETAKLTLEVVNLGPGVGGDGGGGPQNQKRRIGLGGGGERGTIMLHKVFSLIEGPVLSDAKEVTSRKAKVEIAQNSLYPVNVEIVGMDVSVYHFPILFVLEHIASAKLFHIIRELVVNVSTGENLVQPGMIEDSPYKGFEWSFVAGTHEALYENGKTVRRIDEYRIPAELIPILQSNLKYYEVMLPNARETLDYFMALIEEGASQTNYNNYFHMLLYHQEYGEQLQIEKFNMTGVRLELTQYGYIELEVPGLEEKRPSVLEEDLVYFRLRYGDQPSDVDAMQYEARVCRVNQKTIWVEAGNGLQNLIFPGTLFDVRFGLNRFPLMIMHRAVDGMVEQGLLDYVFPQEEIVSGSTSTTNLPKMKFFNKNVEENPEQKQAVINILTGSSMPAPYIVFGPPGTGKTVTLVEAILQVVTLCTDANLLVCAPSNAACDLLAGMIYTHYKNILRLHSKSRDIRSIPESLYPCSNIEDDEIVFPPDYELMKYRIICCTLISAGKLTMGRLPKTHITHVFIDECGQAVEPEAVSAVAGILGSRAVTLPAVNGNDCDQSRSNCQGLLVLGGDPLQLGPVCPGGEIGLGVSLLERLMTKCFLYQRQEESYNARFITKLVRNFRSHPDILILPNKLFYENELEAHSITVLKDPLCLKVFPVHFHCVVGKEEKEGASPSYFNIKELEVVVGHLSILLNPKNGMNIKESEIGVLTPYTRQVYKLKQAFEKKGWNDVEVGSTEVYQGREKRVMIISTVRSEKNLLHIDSMFKLGFLSNAKRFNVATTRAQARLIVVGNPYVLCRDPNWMALIQLTMEHNTFKGAPYNPRDEAFVDRLQPILNQITDFHITS